MFGLVAIFGFIASTNDNYVHNFIPAAGLISVLVLALLSTALNKRNGTPSWLRQLNWLWVLGEIGLIVWFIVGVTTAKY